MNLFYTFYQLENAFIPFNRNGVMFPRKINVCFPCAALHDEEMGRIAVYYGCADTVTGLAFGYIPEIIDFTKRTSIV